MPQPSRIAPVGGLALAGLALLGHVSRAAAQETYWPTHGWQRSSPEAQGMDSKVLAEAFDYIRQRGQRISVVPEQNLVVVFTGGTFEPGDIGNFIGRSIKSGGPLPEDSAGTARLAAAIAEATKPPAAHAVPPLPALAAVVSGKRFSLDANPTQLKAFALTFSGGAEAVVRLELSDGRVERRPVGLDAVPRVSPDGRFGLPVAVSGAWESASTFVLTYDEVGNINAVRLRLTFAGSDVKVEMSERSGLMEARFHGRESD